MMPLSKKTPQAVYDNLINWYPVCGVCDKNRTTTFCMANHNNICYGDHGIVDVVFSSCDDERCVAMATQRAAGWLESYSSEVQKEEMMDPRFICNKACEACGKWRQLVKTYLCARCRAVRYCGLDCRDRHFCFHKEWCKSSAASLEKSSVD